MKIYAQNRSIGYDYFIEETIEAGIVLEGWEVKSIRADRVSVKEAYISTLNGNVELVGMHISPLLNSSNQKTVPVRRRRLLLNRKEINQIMGKSSMEGYTIMPVNIYDKNGKIKLSVAVARGKKKHDKRESIKNKDWEREQSRLLKKR